MQDIVPGITPFSLTADMEVQVLPPMVLATADMQLRDKQMAVHHMYNNINHDRTIGRGRRDTRSRRCASNVFKMFYSKLTKLYKY